MAPAALVGITCQPLCWVSASKSLATFSSENARCLSDAHHGLLSMECTSKFRQSQCSVSPGKSYGLWGWSNVTRKIYCVSANYEQDFSASNQQPTHQDPQVAPYPQDYSTASQPAYQGPPNPQDYQAHSQPAYQNPQWAQNPQGDMSRSQPAYQNPQWAQNPQDDMSRSQPVYQNPQWASNSQYYSQPAYPDPQRMSDAQGYSSYSQPAYQSPQRTSSPQGYSTYSQPAYQSPQRTSNPQEFPRTSNPQEFPTYSQPAYQRPQTSNPQEYSTYRQPAYQSPQTPNTQDYTTYSQPAYQSPQRPSSPQDLSAQNHSTSQRPSSPQDLSAQNHYTAYSQPAYQSPQRPSSPQDLSAQNYSTSQSVQDVPTSPVENPQAVPSPQASNTMPAYTPSSTTVPAYTEPATYVPPYRPLSTPMQRRPYNLEAKMRMKAYRRQGMQQRRQMELEEEQRTFQLDKSKMYPKGHPDTVQGVVREIINIGYLITLPNGREGFLAASHLGCSGGLVLLERLFKVGEEIPVRVIETYNPGGRDRLYVRP